MYEIDESNWKNGIKKDGSDCICERCLAGSLRPMGISVLKELGHEDVHFIDMDPDYGLDHKCIECAATPRKFQLFFLSSINPFLVRIIDQKFKRSGDVSDFGWLTSKSDHENGFPMRHGLKLYVREDSALYEYLVKYLRGDTWTLRVDDLADWRTK
ncbi:hypothetical protein [Deinococcus soli (ex Cha et al. 2016)]|uniref:hypothetical protein n=1 Tax=Deinococcus soli (ex Cha et al. 2016) TaxID=1309411 RepID=UPI0012FF05EC|nr:hypothetical protein [Deinococcus soli (ex Cha et al. 2016)]